MSRSRAWQDLGGGVTALTETDLDERTDEQVEHDSIDLAPVVSLSKARHRSKRTRRTSASTEARVPRPEPTDEGRAIIANIRAQLRGPKGPAGPVGDHHAS